MEKLTEAILAKAFRGDLVPTEAELARREGRQYESGGELIARIHTERAATIPSDGQRNNKKARELQGTISTLADRRVDAQ